MTLNMGEVLMKIKLLHRAVFLLGLCLCMITGLLSGGLFAKAEEGDPNQTGLPERFLKADGKVLRNQSGKGEIVTLRGTNVGGWQVMEAWMCPTNAPDQKSALATLTERFGRETAEELIKVYEANWWQEQDFDNVTDLYFNVLRLPISYFNLLDDEGILREDTLATYDWFVSECSERDIYVILDLHAAPGSQNGRDHSGDKSGSTLFTDETAQNLTVSLWEQLAAHYKGNPTIAGYDFLNEPEGTESERAPWGRVQLPFFNRLYQAVRAIDPDHLIIFNSVWEPTNMPDPSEYGWENVMYEYHYYCWDGTDNVATQQKFTDSKVANDKKAGFEVPVLIGEFTLFDKLQSWEYALSVYEENGWSWTTWTYKTVEMGNWGIYNSTSISTPKVNIYTDSAETIQEKWSKVGTAESFTKNENFYDLLRGMAAGAASENALRKWYQNFEFDEVSLRAGTDAAAELVSSEETHTSREESKVVLLTVSEAERMPTATSRNVCIKPAIRNSVDAGGMDYLLFDVFVRQGDQALKVTLVDKNGGTWSKFTSPTTMPIAYQWEKIFLDISEADIDTSAIIEIRIGANRPGSYYIDDIYFAESYANPLPKETKEEMANDMGQSGVVTDWEDVPVSSIKQEGTLSGILIIAGAAILLITISIVSIFLIRKKIKEKANEVNNHQL
jgi:hypothetical protein